MFELIQTGGPRYLFEQIQFGQSSRLFNLITPAHMTAAKAYLDFVDSFFFFYWNAKYIYTENTVLFTTRP
jgi:hypothetical protein